MTQSGEAGRGTRRRTWAVVALVASLAATAAGPLLLTADYDVVRHTTSEAAAQGVDGAWLTRLGFVLFGTGVLTAYPDRGGRVGRVLHGVFGASLVLVAVFASRPWQEAAPYVASEDLLHSVFATAMGFAFAGAVVASAVHGTRRRHHLFVLDVVAVAASVAIPLAMVAVGDLAGLLQRAMFLVAYAWYLREVWDHDDLDARDAP